MSLAEVATELGISKVLASVIERRALAKLRSLLVERGYRPADLFEATARPVDGAGQRA